MDIKLNYIEKGTGEPLILLHGNGENYEYFTHQLEYFPKKYHVIALDTRGHGKSERGSKPFTIRQFADDLYDFMNEKGIEKAHILGFSDGGNIAMCFALKYPEKVNRLILNGANLNGNGVKAHIQLPIIFGFTAAGIFRHKNPKALKNYEMLGLMVNDPNVKKEELHKLKMPVLVIAGSKDMIKTSHTRLIAQSIPDSRLILMNGDHFIANKMHEEFNAHVEGFLNK
ncbi:MAG: alpha/beta fold hydrolase [Clostridia bacterium]|nr:alpha/beta fold hydrolase [Clostridia bacterium]